MSLSKNIDFHSEHKKWDSALSFYQDEIKTYENRLQEIADKNTSSDIIKSVEQFQNRFIVQKRNIAKLKNHIQKHEIALAANKGVQVTTESDVKHHGIMEGKISDQTTAMKNLKDEFYKFMAKVM
jgi:hypothetical protein